MAKRKRVIKFAVTIDLMPPFEVTAVESCKREAQDIIKEIKRHVDLPHYARADWQVETQAYCSFCGYQWEEDADGTPICCDKAVAELEAAAKVIEEVQS